MELLAVMSSSEKHIVPNESKGITTHDRSSSDSDSDGSRRIKKKKRSARSLLFGTPVVGMVCCYALAATGAFSYLLQMVLSLNAQIDRLELQADRLDTAVTNLTVQVDLYEEENILLNDTVVEFELLNRQLNASNVLFSEQNEVLKGTVTELGDQNSILLASNQEYAEQNIELGATVTNLKGEVDILEAAIAGIGEAILKAAQANKDFLDESKILEGLDGTLSEQVGTINSVITDMDGEISRLEELVDELSKILTFLEDAAENLDESFTEIASFLAEQIETNQNLLKETLSNTYRQVSTSWVCSFESFFGGEAFIEDPNSAIGQSSYSDVIEYVNAAVLRVICLNQGDFESFMAAKNGQNIPPVRVTANQLIRSVSEYTTAALNYYFPDEGEGGLSEEDWQAADFRCRRLPGRKQFSVMAA